MVVALNRGTQILIDNFIDKHFSGSDKVAIKQDALEIADSILEQSNASLKDNLNGLVTKSDLKDEIAPIKSEIQTLKDDIQTLKNEIKELKDDIKVRDGDIQVLKDDMMLVKSGILSMQISLKKKLPNPNMIC